MTRTISNLSELVSKTSSISSDSREMNRNTRQYIMKNDKTSGDQAVGDLNRVIVSMQSLFDSMVDLGFTKTDTEVEMKEENGLESLDHLIAEAMRDIKRNNK